MSIIITKGKVLKNILAAIQKIGGSAITMHISPTEMIVESGTMQDGQKTAIRYRYPTDIRIAGKVTAKISLSPFLKCLGNIAAKDKIQLDLVTEDSPVMKISVLSASTNISEIQTVQCTLLEHYDLAGLANFAYYHPSQTVPLSRTANIAKKKDLTHDSKIPFYGCDGFLCFSSGNSVFQVSDCGLTRPGDVYEIDENGDATLIQEMYHRNILAKQLKCFSSISSIGGANTKMHFYVPKINELPLMCVVYIPSEGRENSSIYLTFGG